MTLHLEESLSWTCSRRRYKHENSLVHLKTHMVLNLNNNLRTQKERYKLWDGKNRERNFTVLSQCIWNYQRKSCSSCYLKHKLSSFCSRSFLYPKTDKKIHNQRINYKVNPKREEKKNQKLMVVSCTLILDVVVRCSCNIVHYVLCLKKPNQEPQ